MGRVLLQHYTAVSDSSMPIVGGRGGVHCSRFCSVFIHSELRGLAVHQAGGNTFETYSLYICSSKDISRNCHIKTHY